MSQITTDTLLNAAESALSDARRLAEMAGGPHSVFAVMAANALSGARLLTARATEG